MMVSSSSPALHSITISPVEFGLSVCLLETQHVQNALAGGFLSPDSSRASAQYMGLKVPLEVKH